MPALRIAGKTAPFAFISASVPSNSVHENWNAASMLHAALKSASAVPSLISKILPAKRYSQGKCEDSFMVTAPDMSFGGISFNLMVELAVKHKQDCFMIVEADCSACLYFPHTDCLLKMNRKFMAISKVLAEQYGNYTLIDGHYHGIVALQQWDASPR